MDANEAPKHEIYTLGIDSVKEKYAEMLELYPEEKNIIEELIKVKGFDIEGVRPEMVKEFLEADKLLQQYATKVQA